MNTHKIRGFTLVELMVVISIIALLVGILLPAISRARDNAKIGQSKSNIRNVKTATSLYENDNNGTPWTGVPQIMSSGPDGSWTGLNIQAAINQWCQYRYYLSLAPNTNTPTTHLTLTHQPTIHHTLTRQPHT